MPSVLYSTLCYIKTDFYRLHIYVDDRNDYSEMNSSDSGQWKDFEFTPTNIPVHCIQPALTRLSFQLLNGKKVNNAIPGTIALHRLLSVQQSMTSSSKWKRTSSSASRTASLEPSTVTATSSSLTPTNEQSREIVLTPNESQMSFKRKESTFRRLFSSSSNTDIEPILLFKTLIRIKYIEISNSIHWKIKTLELEMDTEDLATELYTNLNVCLSTLKQRPHRLLAFVNPLSGKGRAQIIYDHKVLPIFHEANIKVDTIYTERANHARDHVINEALDEYDGLICVGGDGMFAELCHGLLQKTACDAKIDIDNPRVNIIRPNLRIGIIPAGSTDAIVFGTTGLNDPVTSALQIIVGESLSIDITTVHNENGFVRFMATMLAYGFFGDVIQQSNKWRCLGPMRYDLAGFFQFLRHSSYQSELTITLSSTNLQAYNQTQTATSSIISDRQQLINGSNSTLAEATSTNQSSCIVKKNSSKNLEFCQQNCEKCADEQLLNVNHDDTPIQIKCEGRYTTINCLNIPCRCAKSKYGMSPFVHLGDGTFDLILVKRTWRASFLRFLWQVAKDGRSIEQLPNVERYTVREVLIRPTNKGQKQTGHWSCDGELIDGNEILIRVHRQALSLFAVGISLQEKQLDVNMQQKLCACFPCFRQKNDKIFQESNS